MATSSKTTKAATKKKKVAKKEVNPRQELEVLEVTLLRRLRLPSLRDPRPGTEKFVEKMSLRQELKETRLKLRDL